MPEFPWQERLAGELSRLYEDLHPERMPAPRTEAELLQLLDQVPRSGNTTPSTGLDAMWNFIQNATPDQRTAVRRMLAYVETPEWAFREANASSYSEAEQSEFADAHGGRSVQSVEDELVRHDGWVTAQRSAVAAAKMLVAWDLRYLNDPPIMRLLREAQLTDNKALLRELGLAMIRNKRYAKRQKRGQSLLSRVLQQLTYGGRRSFKPNSTTKPEEAEDYTNLVRERLIAAYERAGVPGTDRGHRLVNDREAFLRHLVRLELRAPGRHKKSDSGRTTPRK